MKQIKLLSYEKALRFGVAQFIRHIFTFFMVWACSLVLLATAIVGAISFASILSYITPFLEQAPTNTIQFWLLLIVTLIVGYIALNLTLISIFAYNYQMLRFSMAIYDGTPLSWTEYFSFSRKPFIPYCIARTLYGVKVIAGFALLIIPGIYLALKYYFSGYSILEGSTNSVFQDARVSAEATKDIKWQLIGFVCILWVSSLLVALSVFFLAPILYLAQVHAYKQLK